MKKEFLREPPAEFGKGSVPQGQPKIKGPHKVRRLIIVLSLILGLGVLAYAFRGQIGNSSPGKKSTAQEENSFPTSASDAVTVIQEWNMPKELTEISGLSYLDSDRLVCVQDEIGKIFVYNIKQGKVEKEIPFAAAGDYEGVTVVNKTIWVLRADGVLFEVNNIDVAQPTVKEFDIPLTAAQDCEGLCYDADHNRLLVTVKEKDPNSDAYKGIYAFDLQSLSMAGEPVFKLDVQQDGTAKSGGKKKKNGGIMPAAIAIHPISKDMFITDGPKSRLLVTDKTGAIKKLVQLDQKKFPQPEGITFNATGDLFISNEGKGNPGNILKVVLDTK